MNMRLYTVRDCYSVGFDGIFVAPTDGAAARMITRSIEQSKMDINEYSLFYLGEFDQETGYIKPIAPQSVPWSSYTPVEKLATPLDPSQVGA